MSFDLIDSIEKSNVERVKELLSQNTEINIVDQYGDPLLTLALHKKNADIALMLISSNIDVNIPDAKGQTALHHAAYYGLYNMAQKILEIGGDLNIEDHYGNQPLWTAVFNVKKDLKGMDIVELFLQHGADKNHKNNAGRSPLDFANQVKFAPLLEVLNKY